MNENDARPEHRDPRTPEQIARDEALADRVRADWEWVLGDERGRRCLENIRLRTFPDELMHPTQFQDRDSQQFSLGLRSLGLWIEGEVRKVDDILPERMRIEFAQGPESFLARRSGAVEAQ